jgi:hypothetical protein
MVLVATFNPENIKFGLGDPALLIEYIQCLEATENIW